MTDRSVEDPLRWRALSVMLMGQFAALLDVSVTNVALPSIGRATDATSSELQWVVTGYVLAFGLVPVIGGRLGDGRGRRRMFIIAVSGFTVASALVGFAPTAALIIAARVMQGLFGGMIGPQVSGYIQNSFSHAERGRAFGRLGVTVGVGTAAGPVIAGLLIAAGGPDVGWRLVFFINVPIGIAAVLLARKWVQADRPTGSERVDLLGAVVLGLGVLGVLFPIVESGEGGSPWFFLLLAPAVLLLWQFVRRETRLTHQGAGPLLDVRLFRVSSFVSGVLFAIVFFCSYTGLPLVLSLYYQEGLGFTALQSALGATAFALGSIIGAPLAGRLVAQLGRRLLVGAVSLFALGTVALGLIASADPGLTEPTPVLLRLVVPLFVIGAAGGAIVTPNQTMTLSEIDPALGGAAGGVVQTAQRIGSAIGQTVLGTVFVLVVGTAAGSPALRSPAPHPEIFTAAFVVTAGVSLLFSIGAIVMIAIQGRREKQP